MLARISLALLAVCWSSLAIAWDDFGHRMVLKLTYLQLDPDVRTKVDDLLGGGVTALVEASRSADRNKAGRPDTRPWHYVTIPLGAQGYDRERDCPASDCIVEKLQQFVEVLKSDTATKPEKQEALRFVLRLVADIHQPLHCADNQDRGGSDVALVWEKRKTNLYEVWDHYVLTNTLNQVSESHANGNVVDWCNESHEISRQVVYEGLPLNRGTVSQAYIERARSVATDQLSKAAARLAMILNDVLR